MSKRNPSPLTREEVNHLRRKIKDDELEGMRLFNEQSAEGRHYVILTSGHKRQVRGYP